MNSKNAIILFILFGMCANSTLMSWKGTMQQSKARMMGF